MWRPWLRAVGFYLLLNIIILYLIFYPFKTGRIDYRFYTYLFLISSIDYTTLLLLRLLNTELLPTSKSTGSVSKTAFTRLLNTGLSSIP
jgi:hypothetical protein